jgi:hypothetical protein
MRDSVPGVLAGGTDASREHEIELDGLGDLISGIGVTDVVFSAEFTEFRAGEVVKLKIEKSGHECR